MTRMQIRLRQGLTVIAVMSACALFAQQSPSSRASDTQGTGARALTMTKADAFIRAAARGNEAEIAMGQVAEDRAQNAKVKELAKMIVADHRKANEKLVPLAQAHGITPNQILSGKTEGQLTVLKEHTGAQFDQQYVKDMLRDHAKDIQKFEQAAGQLQEADLKKYAENCLPTLRKHLKHAEAAAKAVGLTPQQISSIEHNTPGGMGGTGERQENQTGKSSNP
jgi:putative membrane protein